MSATTERRGKGPQARAARNDREIIEAAREVFTTQGFDAPIAAVARRAGVGMGSLYRRYRTKESLLQQLCIDSMERVSAAAQRGLANPDPWEGFAGYVRDCVDFGFGELAGLAGTIEVTEELWRAQQEAQQLAERLVSRAHEAGAVRPDATSLDISLLIGQFSRPGATSPLADAAALRRRLLAIALDGLRNRHPERLPGDAPSMARVQESWRGGRGEGPRAPTSR